MAKKETSETPKKNPPSNSADKPLERPKGRIVLDGEVETKPTS